MFNKMLNSSLKSLILCSLLLASCAPGAAPTPQATRPAETPATAPTGAPSAATPNPAAPAATAKPAPDQPIYGGVLPISLYVEPHNLDLQQSQILATRIVAAPAYDGLLEYNPLKQDEIIPDLAERYEVSKDGLVYTFYLHPGVKFHDGSPMTSEDVKYNLDRLRDPPKGVLSPKKDLLASIDKIETPDPNTVKIVTKYPDASFIGGIALSHHVIYPKKVLEEKGSMKQIVNGTGPFKLKNRVAGSIVDYVSNKDYFRKGRPYLDGLKLYTITDSATRFAAFRTGRIWVTSPGSGGLTPTQAEITQRDLKGKARAIVYIQLSNTFTMINTSRKPLDDVRVRQALHLLADRPALLKAYGEGAGTIAVYFTPEPWGKFEFTNAEILALPGYRPDKAADVAEAKRLLAEAGYPKGFSLSLTVRTNEPFNRMDTAYREQVKAAGIDLKIEILEVGVWTNRKTLEDYDLLRDSWGVHDDDPTAWFSNILTTETSFKDTQLDAWVKEQSKILDFAERKKLVRKIELRLLELVPTMPSWRAGVAASGVWDNVKNYAEPIGLWNCNKFTEVWLAK